MYLKKVNEIFNQILCYERNGLQKQYPSGVCFCRRSKCGYAAHNHCHATPLGIITFSNWLRNPPWSCIYLIIFTFSKQSFNASLDFCNRS